MRGVVHGVLVTTMALSCGEPGDGDEVLGTTTSDTHPVGGPDFEVRYRTQYVDIAPGFSQPVCRGTLDEIDRHVEAVAELLDIDLRARITWYWFNEHAEGPRLDVDWCDWCPTCYSCTSSSRSSGTIYSSLSSVYHELVHGLVTPSWGRSDVIFEEGIAHGLNRSHREVGAYPEVPSELAGGTKHGGAAFSRWLVDRFGPQAFRELFSPRLGVKSTKEEVFAAVEEVYGIPFLELEAEYFATAPLVYPAPGLCDGLLEVPWQGDVWELSVTTDCDAPHVFGPRDLDAGIGVSVTMDVPDLGGATVIMSAVNTSGGWLTPCYDEPVDDESELRYTTAAGEGVGVPNLRPGRYRVDLSIREPGKDVYLRIGPW